jgi:hypothetical protein
MAFKPKSKDNLKNKKKIQGSKQILHKTYSPKIWKKINVQICKNNAVNGQQNFGKEKNYRDKANID